MASQANLTVNQTEQDLQLGVDAVEQWKHLASDCREKGSIAHSLPFRLAFNTLAGIAELGLHSLEAVLDAMRPDVPLPRRPEGLHPIEPEWRPGTVQDKGDC